jgi:hypothetical protein
MNFNNVHRFGWNYSFRVGGDTEPWKWTDLLNQPAWVPAYATAVLAVAVAASFWRYRSWGRVWWFCILLPLALISMLLTWSIPFHFD